MAQRNCDIILSCIKTNFDKGIDDGKTPQESIEVIFNNPYSTPVFNAAFTAKIAYDTAIDAYSVRDPSGAAVKSYDPNQYAEIEQITSESSLTGDSGVKKQYYIIDVSNRKLQSGTSTEDYAVYKVTTYTYYSSDGYVSCEGEVNIEK